MIHLTSKVSVLYRFKLKWNMNGASFNMKSHSIKKKGFYIHLIKIDESDKNVGLYYATACIPLAREAGEQQSGANCSSASYRNCTQQVLGSILVKGGKPREKGNLTWGVHYSAMSLI